MSAIAIDRIKFFVGPERIRQIGSSKAGNIRQMTTVEAEAFFTLYKDALQTVLEDAVKRFVVGKL